ncbi:hypothetical protein BSLG_008648 [Batrachochytrium salamandrivorans]|nr:hypothetical protein BSLG_008648 [Batrachochytrium salamandrivorans]
MLCSRGVALDFLEVDLQTQPLPLLLVYLFDTNPNRPKQDMNKINRDDLFGNASGRNRRSTSDEDSDDEPPAPSKSNTKGKRTPSPTNHDESEDQDSEDDDVPEVKPTTRRPKQGTATPQPKIRGSR